LHKRDHLHVGVPDRPSTCIYNTRRAVKVAAPAQQGSAADPPDLENTPSASSLRNNQILVL